MGAGRTFDFTSYDTDKVPNRYLDTYAPVLSRFAGEPVKLLELGVWRGGSLLLWRDYFPGGTVVGLDMNPVAVDDPEGRVHVHQGRQEDAALLTEISGKHAPDGWDIIIDDASHWGDLTRASFWHLFDNHLKPGGLYVVEDWGTGYWDDWHDGRTYRPRPPWLEAAYRAGLRLGLTKRVPAHNHSYGMVGFIKELVDEMGAADLTRKNQSGTAERNSRFASVTVTASIVFVDKPR